MRLGDDVKSERQKMLAGELYRATDPELVHLHLRAHEVMVRYNAIPLDNAVARASSLRDLFGAVGENVVVMSPFFCDYGFNITVGNNLFVNYNCVFLDCNQIIIGDDVQIGPSVQIYTATHPLDPNVRRSGLESARPVRIGNNVWIGGAAVILPGVSIGDDAVVGAGSVVTADVPAGALVIGNPARTRS